VHKHRQTGINRIPNKRRYIQKEKVLRFATQAEPSLVDFVINLVLPFGIGSSQSQLSDFSVPQIRLLLHSMSTEQPEVVAASPSDGGVSPGTRSGSRAPVSRSIASGSRGAARTSSEGSLGSSGGSSGERAAPSRSKSGKYVDRIDASGGHALKPLPASSATEAQNSFSAESPYFGSYVENEMQSLNVMNDTLRDIAGRTKTFGKCGALMAEATRRLALSCKLRRPFTINPGEDQKEMEAEDRKREGEVLDRRHAVGEDMAGLLAVMSEVS
jgi:hypothetical protein